MADSKTYDTDDNLEVCELDDVVMLDLRNEFRDAWITVSEMFYFQVLYKHFMLGFVEEQMPDRGAEAPSMELSLMDCADLDAETRLDIIANLELAGSTADSAKQPVILGVNLDGASPAVSAATCIPLLQAVKVAPQTSCVTWQGSSGRGVKEASANANVQNDGRGRKRKVVATPEQIAKAVKNALTQLKCYPRWQKIHRSISHNGTVGCDYGTHGFVALQAVLGAKGDVKCFACRTLLEEVKYSPTMMEEELAKLRTKEGYAKKAREDMRLLAKKAREDKALEDVCERRSAQAKEEDLASGMTVVNPPLHPRPHPRDWF